MAGRPRSRPQLVACSLTRRSRCSSPRRAAPLPRRQAVHPRRGRVLGAHRGVRQLGHPHALRPAATRAACRRGRATPEQTAPLDDDAAGVQLQRRRRPSRRPARGGGVAASHTRARLLRPGQGLGHPRIQVDGIMPCHCSVFSLSTLCGSLHRGQGGRGGRLQAWCCSGGGGRSTNAATGGTRQPPHVDAERLTRPLPHGLHAA